jgi:hypothetical protein
MQYTTKIKNLMSKELVMDANEEMNGIESIEYAEIVRRQLEQINKRSIKMDVSENTVKYSFDRL